MIARRARQWLPPLARLALAVFVLAASLAGVVSVGPVPVVEAASEYYGQTVDTSNSVNCNVAGAASAVGAPDGNVATFSIAAGPGPRYCWFDIDFDDIVATDITLYLADSATNVFTAVRVWNVTTSAFNTVWANTWTTSGNRSFSLSNGAGHVYSFVRIEFGNGCGGCGVSASGDWTVDGASATGPTHTPTPTPTPTNTPTPSDTPTATNTPTATPPGGDVGGISRNHLINTDFNAAPKTVSAGWTDINKVIQAPLLFFDPLEPIEHMPQGSCGPKYWVMSTPGGQGDASFWQQFSWNGGQMFINLEALTDSYRTRGRVSIVNLATGATDPLTPFSNGTFNWLSFKWVTETKPAGEYRMVLDYESTSSDPAVAVDNVNVRRGYWGNDCPPEDYVGQIPPQMQATVTPLATVTPIPFPDGGNRLNNCGFEQGWSSYSHNQGSRLFYTGGATGPTYAYLFTRIGRTTEPIIPDLPGHLWQPFNWPGGRMYVTYFTGPGTRVATSIRNLFTGSVYEMQSAGTLQSFNGWTKRSYSFVVSDPGQYILDARSPVGQIAALDGFTVASGAFASGACANANSSGDNNATATAHATSSQIAATAAPGLTQTADANEGPLSSAYQTHVAGVRQTMTQNAAATQTALPPALTQTQAARQTSIAQGTHPIVTRTPAPTVCVINPQTGLCWIVAPPVTVVYSDVELTEIAAEMNATLTQQAADQATYLAQAQATATARAQATQQRAQTQTQAPLATQTAAAVQTQRAAQTQNAANNQTATAIAVGISAQQTQNALATQHAQQAAATQTAAALQTEISGGVDPATEAAATTTAQAHATQFAGVTATAIAQHTANAVNTANAQSTANSQATANSAATAVSLATQNAQQAQATTTAAALQTQLAGAPDATAEAQATTTAQAHATTAAQTTATAQVQLTNQVGTQIAQGTQVTGPVGDLPPVDERPEPQAGADCIRPSSPLQIANWIDYEVCRVLTWFAWSPDNTAQMQGLTQMCEDRYPCGLMLEVREVFDVFIGWAQSIPCAGGFCGDEPLTEFNITARGILLGEFDFSDAGPSYGTECDLLLAPIVGPAIQTGACFCLNVMCALGILPWTQLIWNIVMAFLLALYVQRTWFSAAHT
jgi:hypothetical protein